MKITGKKLTDEDLDKVAGGCGYPGEDPGYDNDNAMDDQMDSLTHRDDIMHGKSEKIEINLNEIQGKYYWAQEFGY